MPTYPFMREEVMASARRTRGMYRRRLELQHLRRPTEKTADDDAPLHIQMGHTRREPRAPRAACARYGQGTQ
jgi:hypothetical protein